MNRQRTSRVITGHRNARSRIGSVKVVAFRDSAHRTAVLTHLAGEFMHSWIQGAKEGPTDKIMREIGSIASDDIKIRSSHPITEDWEASGLSGLKMKLALDHHSEAFIFDKNLHPGDDKVPLPFIEMKDGVKLWLHGSMRPIRTVLTAANEEADVVFCLVECEERLHESKDDSWDQMTRLHEIKDESSWDPKMRLGPEKVWDHKVYSIVKFDCLYDDTSRLITGITEMRQLGLSDITSIAKSPTDPEASPHSTHSPFLTKELPDSDLEETEKEIARNVTLQLPGTWDFPTSHLVAYQKEMGPSRNEFGEAHANEVKKQSILKWSKAWQTGEDEEALIKSVVSHDKGVSRWAGGDLGQYDGGAFHLWQGWMKVDWQRLPTVLKEIKEKKEIETIEATVIDLAICKEYNVGFSHWKAKVAAHGGRGTARENGGMSVFLFDGEGLIEDVWTLKTPGLEEKARMKDACIALSRKMSRIEWA